MMTTSIPDLSFRPGRATAGRRQGGLAAAAARSPRTGGQEHRLRQTVMALAQGEQQHEHEPRGEATLQVLQQRHSIEALTDLPAVPP